MSEEEWYEWILDPLMYERGGVIVKRCHWVERLFLEFVYPCLKQNKFQLVGKPDKIIRKFMWFWRHLAVCGYDVAEPLAEPVAKNLSRPLREYYDIFFNIINSSIFEDLIYISAAEGAFDDTYLGRRLLAELPNFLWSNLDLVNSQAFIEHENTMAEIEEGYRQLEEGDMTLEELDRRRMKNKGHDPDYVYDKHA